MHIENATERCGFFLMVQGLGHPKKGWKKDKFGKHKRTNTLTIHNVRQYKWGEMMSLQEETDKQEKSETATNPKEAPIDRETRIAIMKFFFKTSAPRILKAQKELAQTSLDAGEAI